MATSPFPDPLQLWREAISKLETETNTLATGGLKSPEVMRTLQQVSNVSLSLQQAHEKAVEAYLQRANLPSRRQLDDLAEALARIEEKVDRLLPRDAAASRPARTRRPAPMAATAAPAAAPAKSTPAPKTASRKTAARRKS